MSDGRGEALDAEAVRKDEVPTSETHDASPSFTEVDGGEREKGRTATSTANALSPLAAASSAPDNCATDGSVAPRMEASCAHGRGEETREISSEESEMKEDINGDRSALSQKDAYSENGSEHESEDAEDDGDLKQKGLVLFEKRDFEGAIDCWKRGLRAVNFVLSKDIGDAEKTREFEKMKLSYLLNLSLGSLKAEQFGACVRYCDDVLDTDPFHLKALFRKAQALHSLGRLEDSLAMVESLLDAHPNNPAAVSLEQKLKRELHAYRKKERQMAKVMLESMDADPRSNSVPQAAGSVEKKGFFNRVKSAFGFSKEASSPGTSPQASSSGASASPSPFLPFSAFPSSSVADAVRQFEGGNADNPFASLFECRSPFGAGGPQDPQRLSQDMRDLQRLMELNQRLMQSGDDAGFFEKVRLAWAFCCFAGRALFDRGWAACKRRCTDTCSRRKRPAEPYFTVSPLGPKAAASQVPAAGYGVRDAFAGESSRGKKTEENTASASPACGQESQVPRFEEVDDGARVAESAITGAAEGIGKEGGKGSGKSVARRRRRHL
ncbi:tetratricopeptide repeat-containing protein [Toxoplasma gondii ME49]|nr:tetratricopeptide repeat-containing protein [Toxoplasma gondii ME49]EPT30468.1 tetratricopeptide repeat-containing protein [Toxoplasma gondii ME49]ESS31693.1 tetratricopeptide repeat-containing protein [Toxoplasma gondii VEG]|eukprot:XP_002366840.2 tetratricopeptide repeat-containing protein [Toxoplasma gondii ME49]